MKRLVLLPAITIFALFNILVSSCTKELTPIGMGLLNPQDMLSQGYTDTIQINAFSIPDDSVYSLKLSYAQVGSMNDPIFGITNATFYSQLYTTTTNVRFGTSPVFDSAFLFLPYKTTYGDTLSNMTLHVYPLTESILDSVHSYSNKSVSYDQNNPLGEITFQPRPHDSAYFGGSKHIAMLRIPISSYFGNLMLNADTTSLNTAAAFAKYFKGICIMADQQNDVSKGSIITFSVPSSYSVIQMYYHNTVDTTSYTFAITTGCSRFQNYSHNGYSEAIPTLKQQIKGDTLLGKQFLFAQGMAGAKIHIKFPYISTWADKDKILVNDAELILGNASTSSVFTNPASLTLRGVGEAGTTSPYSVVDETESSTYFDGTYNSTSNTYRFRLTRYIQQLLQGKVNTHGLHLIIPSASYVGTRLVLNGTSSPQTDMKLFIRYTKLK